MKTQPPKHTAPGSSSAEEPALRSWLEQPRVVILDDGGEARVEVIELPERSRPGDVFCHCGTRWQVTATRTGERVLIARPLRA
jgi:hypothetical protein